MTRRDRIIVLAWSLLDAIHHPPTATGVIAAGERRGEAPGGWRLCETCDGNGTTTDRFHRPQPCPSCNGAGRYEIDAFTDHRVSTWLSPAPARVEHVGCAWCQPSHGQEPKGRWETLPRGTGVTRGQRCQHCNGTGLRSLTMAEQDSGPRSRGQTDLVAWTMRGDWPALTHALALLRKTDRQAHNTFLDEASQGAVRSERALAGLAFLEDTMPHRLRVPGQVLEAYGQRDRRRAEAEKARLRRLGVRARVSRQSEIRRLRVAGWSSAEVARLVGVPERTVRRVATH